MFNLPDKKLATTQDGQALQNSDEKQYCQYWMLPEPDYTVGGPGAIFTGGPI